MSQVDFVKILFLSPYQSSLKTYLESFGDRVWQSEDTIDRDYVVRQGIDILVSYGYQHIIDGTVLDRLDGRAVNLHVSYLPWNRGAHPNLWSFIEDTPKGVTIHFIDTGIDTGDIVEQREVSFTGTGTLATSYERLKDEVEALFREVWPAIRNGTAQRRKQQGPGSYHGKKDLAQVAHLLTDGWNTSLASLSGAGGPKGRRTD